MTITSDLLRRVEDILFMVASLPEAKRASAADEACRGDPVLADEVRSLLGIAGRIGRFLEEPALGTDFTLLPATADEAGDAARDELVGQMVGRYRIEGRIASGGMGTIYLAQRADDQFTQRVAIKIVKRGMDSEEILHRFRAERQTLAALNHPNIARLLDGGATESGQPYLVMEYVEGEPIDEYCDRRRMANADRLRLFLVVCDAVRFAHQNLVVHRDLKPGNILVSADGTPKLLDFGIAKVIAPGGAPHATAPQERRLTPEYASPEQVTGRMPTTTSDVYSLGIILYELLTGHRPYDFPTRTPAEIERVVVDGLTPAPSDVVTRVETRPAPGGGEGLRITPETVSLVRDATPEQLRRRLRGDLDTIVLAALRKEPERRYASVEQLANDVRRHLDGLPVSARRDTLGYRTAKFVLRHVVGTTLATLGVLLLAAAVVAFAWQARVASRQRDEAFAARDQSEATTTFLQDMLASADPGESGPAATVQELLDAAAERLDGDLHTQPLVQASLRSTIGRTYLSLGLYDEAELQLRRGYEQRLGLLGPRHHDVAESMNDLAALLYARGSLDEAATLLRGALEIFREVRGDRNPDAAKTLSSLGAVLRAQGNLDEAESMQRRSLEIRRAISGADSLDVAESLNNLGVLLSRNRLDEAEAALTEALAIRRARLDTSHPLVSQSVDNLASLLHQRGDLDRAEPLYREALALEIDRLGASHPDVAITQKNLAILHMARGELAEAEELLRACLAIREPIYPPTEPRVFLTQIDLADIVASRGDWGTAASLLEAALASAKAPSTSAGTRARAFGRAADVFEAHGDAERAKALRAAP
jgi:serine/threonine-protein kinase